MTAPTPRTAEGGDPSGAPGAPTAIGPYKILVELGEGGMGSVYLAERRDPHQRVALKLIKLGMDSKAVLARFQAERQALALMEHSNIAKVFDAGSASDGRPYFVMEYVKGVPITRYCDDSKLGLEDRLLLFRQVCAGVQHAHSKGVVHRDLTPNNVLVTVQDGKPTAKIIDFGLARATERHSLGGTIFTEQGVILGTPEYMSPEQAGFGGLDVDTRSDVYTLGVLLYELLVGDLPFGRRELQAAGFAEMQRTIRDADPPRPSTKMTAQKRTAGEAASRRRTDASSLLQRLRGDLDWIVMKCLEKDRTRRYETVAALSDDVQRHLDQRPIEARPPSAGYVLRKLAARYRGQIVAAAAVLLALLGGLASTTYFMLDARAMSLLAQERAAEARQQERLAAERAAEAEAASQLAKANALRAVEEAQRAEREALAAGAARDESEQIAKFMSGMLEGAGPLVAGGRDTTMLREMLDVAASRIEKGELASAARAEIRLRGTIGEVYRQIGAYDRAHKMLAPALDLARSLHPGDHADVADALTKLAELLCAKGEDPRAIEQLFQQALEMRQRLHTGDHRDVAESLNNAGVMLQSKGDLAGAEPLLRAALAMRKRLFPGDAAVVAESLTGLGHLQMARNDLAGAEALFREAFEMWMRVYPNDHPRVALGSNNLANVLLARGDVSGAEHHFRQSLAMVQRVFPGDHPQVGLALGNLARVLHASKDLVGAERLYREGHEMYARVFQGDHTFIATNLCNLGTLARDQGKLDDAEAHFRQAAEMWQRLYPGGLQAASAIRNVADLCMVRGDFAGAEPLYLDALATYERLAAKPDIEEARGKLIKIYEVTSRPALAEPLLRKVIENREGNVPAGDLSLAIARSRLGICLTQQGRFAAAEPLLIQGFRAFAASADTPRTPQDFLKRACEGVVRNYEAWDAAERAASAPGKAAEVARWREQLASLPLPAGTSTKQR